MLNKTENNTYSLSVSSREFFLYKLDFEHQQVIFVYTCKTDNYTYEKSYSFLEFNCNVLRIEPCDYNELVDLIEDSISTYLRNNIISGSVRRAWIKFKDELISIYNALVMSQTYKIL